MTPYETQEHYRVLYDRATTQAERLALVREARRAYDLAMGQATADTPQNPGAGRQARERTQRTTRGSARSQVKLPPMKGGRLSSSVRLRADDGQVHPVTTRYACICPRPGCRVHPGRG